MATIFTDDFNSYSNGDLNGQGSWSGDATFDIQGTTTYEGAKAVYWDGSSVEATITKIGTAQTDGRITLYMRPGQTNKRGEVRLRQGTTNCIRFYFIEDGNFYYSALGDILYGAYAANTWYQIEVEWRSSDGYARYNLNSAGWTDWQDTLADWTTGIDRVYINTQDPAGIFYFDYIAENPLETTDIKSINGLAKASIKSVNGLAIASVKSWNNLE